jgi:hypothetical protein
MSYYCNRGGIIPGQICGNPLTGLDLRAAISCRRILDSCKKCITREHERLVLRNVPSEAVQPFTFVCGTSTQIDACVRNLCVDRLEERPCFARIKCDVVVPIQVTFRDSLGNCYTASSEVTVHEDIVMYVPEASMFPFEIVATASCSCPSGCFDEQGNCCANECLTVITKVIAETDMLVPSYGYSPTPDAVDYEEQICGRFFDLPMYPNGR